MNDSTVTYVDLCACVRNTTSNSSIGAGLRWVRVDLEMISMSDRKCPRNPVNAPQTLDKAAIIVMSFKNIIGVPVVADLFDCLIDNHLLQNGSGSGFA